MTDDDDLHRSLAAIADAIHNIEGSVTEAIEYGRSAQRRVREWGFLGIARNMENILNAFAELEQRRRSVSDDLADCLSATTSADGAEPPERTVTRLTVLAHQLERVSSATSTAVEQAADTVRIVGAVLVGGKPEPLQRRAGGIGDAFGAVAGQLSAARATVQRSILSALHAGLADHTGIGPQPHSTPSGPLAGADRSQQIPESSADAMRARIMGDGQGRASMIAGWAVAQGWVRQQSAGGPPKYVDANGIRRVTIKRGSVRTPGSENPHVELRDENGRRIDPFGNPIERRSVHNHTPVVWDLE